jgi:hypothetical protein
VLLVDDCEVELVLLELKELEDTDEEDEEQLSMAMPHIAVGHVGRVSPACGQQVQLGSQVSTVA